MEQKTCRQLWRDYAFLTAEMKKFTSLVDWLLLEDLMRQREALQAELTRRAGDDFRDTAEGQTLLRQVHADQEQLLLRIGALQRRTALQHSTAGAYEGLAVPAARLERQG